MSIIRSEMVKEAKRTGVCTQCFRNPTQKFLTCDRCLETNRRKRLKRRGKYLEYQASCRDFKKQCASHNKLRIKVMNYAESQGICTKCFGRPAEQSLRQCDMCLERKRVYKERKPRPLRRPKMLKQRKTVPITKQREYTQKYLKKALVRKVIKLDRIRYAIEHGKTLPVSTTIKTGK